mgnify:CR=1 FL=1
MRTIVSLAAILSLAVAGAILGGSGFAAAWGAEPPTTAAAAQDRLDESSSNVQPSNNPIDGPVSSADDSIIGLIGSGLGSVSSNLASTGGGGDAGRRLLLLRWRRVELPA